MTETTITPNRGQELEDNAATYSSLLVRAGIANQQYYWISIAPFFQTLKEIQQQGQELGIAENNPLKVAGAAVGMKVIDEVIDFFEKAAEELKKWDEEQRINENQQMNPKQLNTPYFNPPQY